MKSILLSIIALLWSYWGIAQAPPISWEHSYGGSDYDEVKQICPSGDGGFVFAGSTYSLDGDITSVMHGNADCLVMKINSSGGLLWQRTIGGSSMDRASSILRAADNGFIIGGYTASDDDDVTGNHGSGDAWIVKLDDTGGIVWQKCYGGTGFDYFFSVIPCIDGGYFAVGNTNSTDGDVVGYGATSSLQDLWAVKVDAAGAIEWQQTMGGAMGAIGRAALQTSDSSYVIAGYTISTDGDVTGNHGGVDNWVIKLSSNGTVLWKKCYGGSYLDACVAICPAAGGGVMLAGQTVSTDGDVSHFYGGDINGGDAWIVKLDDTGAIVWEKSYGGSGNEQANSIRPATGNNYIIGGWTESRDGDVTGRKDTNDAWVLLISDAGTLQWQKCLGGTARDMAFDVIQTSDSEFIAACMTTSRDSDVSFNNGLNDCWLVKLSNPPTTSVSIADSRLALQITPNPSSGHLVLHGSSPGDEVAVNVTDITGRQVYHKRHHLVPGDFSIPVEISSAPGIYYMRVASGGRAETIPFVLRK
ncbi:MAG: T9SS type A sorting domain-containing protein [Taibaiella sp.]|nr:T9SS type A sorting domain-containing protein [Taibaiella sp.]